MSTEPSRGGSPTSAADIARLDAELVARGLARSRGHARSLIDEALVSVDGLTRPKPASEVSADTPIELVGPISPWVNRGAEKLEHALRTWPIPVEGRRALDVGASTGGFTQVLLAHGASHVIALDVGHGQLHPVVASDTRVENREGTSIRDLRAGDLDPVGIVVADLSFISLTLAMGPIAQSCAAGADIVLLVKPQFEVGREGLGKNGIVTDDKARRAGVQRVIASAGECGLVVRDLIDSPIRGTHGNQEHLLWLNSEGSPG